MVTRGSYLYVSYGEQVTRAIARGDFNHIAARNGSRIDVAAGPIILARPIHRAIHDAQAIWCSRDVDFSSDLSAIKRIRLVKREADWSSITAPLAVTPILVDTEVVEQDLPTVSIETSGERPAWLSSFSWPILSTDVSPVWISLSSRVIGGGCYPR